MGSQGECLPRKENYVTLDPDKKDAWGIPALHIVASYGENERAMARAMRHDIGAILDELQLDQVAAPSDEISVFGKNIHECGTARMGGNPKTSVVDRDCKCAPRPEPLCQRRRRLSPRKAVTSRP